MKNDKIFYSRLLLLLEASRINLRNVSGLISEGSILHKSDGFALVRDESAEPLMINENLLFNDSQELRQKIIESMDELLSSLDKIKHKLEVEKDEI